MTDAAICVDTDMRHERRSPPQAGGCPHLIASLCIVAGACHGVGTGKVSGSDSTDRSAAVKVSSVPGLIS